MFDLFIDKKPLVLNGIGLAIKEAKKEMENISHDIAQKKGKINITTYWIEHLMSPVNEIQPIIVNKISSRDMYQALNKVSGDTKYDVDEDKATGSVDGFDITLSRHKDQSGTYIIVLAQFSKILDYISSEANKYSG